jgi:hypothetical protein
VLFGEFENLFECRDALAREFAAEPGACVETAQLGQREVVDPALTIRGAIDSVVMNRDEAGVARELQIGLDESGAERDGSTKCGQSVLRRMSRRPSMCYDKHGCGSRSLR